MLFHSHSFLDTLPPPGCLTLNSWQSRTLSVDVYVCAGKKQAKNNLCISYMYGCEFRLHIRDMCRYITQSRRPGPSLDPGPWQNASCCK